MPTTVKTLRMLFRNDSGTTSVISVPEPKDPVVAQEVENCMDFIVAQDIFAPNAGDLTEKIRAEVVERTVEDVYTPA